MRIVFGEDLGYIKRWCFITKWFSIRLHHWVSSDDLRNPHNHAWSFVTIVFRGFYTDISPDGEELIKAPCVRYRKFDHIHSVMVPAGGCWSLLITGAEKNKWGFFVNGKFRKRNKYFYEWGHH